MDGKEFFNTHRGDREMCKRLMDYSEDVLKSWELTPVSDYSPGIVDDEEIIYQQIIDPTNLDEAKTSLKPTAFDTASGIGMSTNRLVGADMQQLIDRGINRANAYNEKYPDAPPRSLWGFVPLPVKLVRGIISQHSQGRGLYVYDTANPDDPSHADICQCVKEPRNVRSVRFQLYDLVKGTVLRLQDIQTG